MVYDSDPKVYTFPAHIYGMGEQFRILSRTMNMNRKHTLAMRPCDLVSYS